MIDQRSSLPGRLLLPGRHDRRIALVTVHLRSQCASQPRWHTVNVWLSTPLPTLQP